MIEWPCIRCKKTLVADHGLALLGWHAKCIGQDSINKDLI